MRASIDVQRDPASYRDPAGYVILDGQRILRVVTPYGRQDYVAFASSRIFQSLQERRWIPRAWDVTPELYVRGFDGIALAEQERLDFISYPYEWTFEALKAAAIRHLDVHLALLENGFTLKDASAYNIQFDGAEPLFIDLLSIRQYRDGEYWLAQNQFVRQFLVPLLLESAVSIPFQPWLRSCLEGIDPKLVIPLLPWRMRLDYRLWLQLFLPSYFDGRSRRLNNNAASPSLPRSVLVQMLLQLRQLIETLPAPKRAKTNWSAYSTTNSYSAEMTKAKESAVYDFVAKQPGARIADVGCNDGYFANIALNAGAHAVFGIDGDLSALDRGYLAARRNGKPFTAIVQDLANPSPAQGWGGEERPALAYRLRTDALVALAIVHHLSIGRNVPLPQVAEFLRSLSKRCLIEFVPKDDAMVKVMLAQREDIFVDYTAQGFEAAFLAAGGQITCCEILPGSNRRLYTVQFA